MNKTQTWKTKSISGASVTIVDGIVTQTDFPAAAPLGGKADAKHLRACGWKPIPAPKGYIDAFGRRNFADGRIARR